MTDDLRGGMVRMQRRTPEPLIKYRRFVNPRYPIGSLLNYEQVHAGSKRPSLLRYPCSFYRRICQKSHLPALWLVNKPLCASFYDHWSPTRLAWPSLTSDILGSGLDASRQQQWWSEQRRILHCPPVPAASYFKNAHLPSRATRIGHTGAP